MTLRSLLLLPLTLLIFLTGPAAQERPIGYWRAHLPYGNAEGIATDGKVIYVITRKAFFTFNSDGGEINTYSKVEGMHETNPVALAYDRSSSTAVIAYDNSNIDLFHNNNFKVLPDLKNKSFSGSKAIHNIYTARGKAYLSTGLGIIVIDLDKQEVMETYVFSKGGQTIGINAFTADSQYFYAATTSGLYRISRNAPSPQVFGNWRAVDTAHAYNRLAVVQNTLFATSDGFTDTLFRLSAAGALQPVYHRDTASITDISGGQSLLYIGYFQDTTHAGRTYHFSLDNAVVDSSRVAAPRGALETDDGRLWLSDSYQGLAKRNPDGGLGVFVPQGPNDFTSLDLYTRNGEVWVAHGGIAGNFSGLGTNTGISHFKDESWSAYQPYNYPLFRDTVADFMKIVKDERDGTLYAGTVRSGIFQLKADGTGSIIKQGALEASGAGLYPALGMAIDLGGNLWVNQSQAANELAVRTPAGMWYHYAVPRYSRLVNIGYKMIVDDLNQKWYVTTFGGGGVIVYNDKYTPEDGSDDDSRNLVKGKGLGNLPSDVALSLAKDRDGAVWIGTSNGIAIVNNPGAVLTDKTSDAEQRIVQYDQFAGYLFAGESVQAIAVDGANRKWIGTGNGVWLLSPDASKIINRFTTDNSPLPSNIIQSISVDGVTGDVYIGTQDGLVSYRSTATDGGTVNVSTVQTFPNPVPAGYSGQIAMRGFVTDADVRITDIAGQLIYRTKALGGQAVWSGEDYTGHRPQSGVLLIFATNKDGTQTAVGKMMMMH